MPANQTPKGPPRPIHPGDVVACYSDELGEWTVAQITDLNPAWKMAGVLELDWSGDAPASVGVLGKVSPLVLTHHGWAGRPSHTNLEWVLPRSYKVIGSLPLLRDKPSDSLSAGWRVGMQLSLQRKWDRGERGDPPSERGELKIAGPEFNAQPAEKTRENIWSLEVDNVRTLDCARLVQTYPGVHRLFLSGSLGRLENAAELNGLSHLKTLAITNLFGMTKSDCLLPEAVPALEWLALHSVPREYGAAMRSAWAPELVNGCFTAVSGLRAPEWLAENLDNPLREWDGREHISAAKFRKSVAQYKTTRRAVKAVLAEPAAVDLKVRLIELGREYGEAFNKLARRDDFIETEEREELFTALMAIPADTGLLSDVDATQAGEWLVNGLDEVRDW